jgi:cytochrome c biogenesis protein CcdA
VVRDQVPYALAFSAGLLATVNPCGFALLPSFVGYYLGARRPGASTGASLVDGLVVGVLLTTGFLAVFGSVGLVVALGARAVVEVVPWAAIGIGIGLVGVGLWLLAGRRLSVRLPGLRPSVAGGYRTILAFGVAYGVGSLSCTLPIFLVVVGSAVSAGSPLDTVGVVFAYALGMATILMLLSLATAGFREVLVRAIRPLLAHASRISGVLLVLGGSYVVYYWAALLSGSGESGAIEVVQDLQARAQEAILRPGEPVWLAVGATLLAGALLAYLLRRGRDPGSRPTASDELAVELELESEEREAVWVARND